MAEAVKVNAEPMEPVEVKSEPVEHQDEVSEKSDEQSVELRKIKTEETLKKLPNVSSTEVLSEEDDKSVLEEDINLEALVQQVGDSSQPEIQLEAVTTVRKLFSWAPKLYLDPLINLGIVPSLVSCLDGDNCDIQLQAVWALTNVASGTSEQTRAVVEGGAVPKIIAFLASPHQGLCEQAVWALGNIIGDGPKCRDYAISLGVLAPLFNLIHPGMSTTLLRNITWVISNLCRCTDPALSEQSLNEVLPMLNLLADHTDTQVLVNIVWALNYLTNGGNDKIQMVIDSGVLPKLVLLLSHHDFKLQRAVVGAVGNIATGTDEQTQTIINCGALGHFVTLLTHQNAKICKEALWVLSNVTAGNSAQVQAVMDAGLIPLIKSHLEEGVFQTQKEAAWTVTNISLSGNKKQVLHLISFQIIPPLCDLLSCGDPDAIRVVLDGIQNMLSTISGGSTNGEEVEQVCYMIEECGGLDKIEILQNHENLDIYKLAYDIIENYFSEQIDVDPNLVSESTVDVDNVEAMFQFGHFSPNNTAEPEGGFNF